MGAWTAGAIPALQRLSVGSFTSIGHHPSPYGTGVGARCPRWSTPDGRRLVRVGGDEAEHVEEPAQIVRVVAVAGDDEPGPVDLVVRHPVGVCRGTRTGDRPAGTGALLADIPSCAADAHRRFPRSGRPTDGMGVAREQRRPLLSRKDRAGRPHPVRFDVIATPVAVTCTLPIAAIRCTPLPG